MPSWTRRRLLQSGAAAVAASRLTPHLQAGAPAPRQRLRLDSGWRFHLGHASDPAQDFGFGQGSEFDKSGDLFRPSAANFDDSAWRAVELPHDWAVELPYVRADELNDHGDHPLGRNYPATSIGWYRRVFTVPASDSGRRFTIDFDGVYRDALIALNGRLVGRNASGYAPYHADITDLLAFGGRNVLVVRVDATQREGWFYEGAGIYRHVWLTSTAPVHVAHWGTFVTSTAATTAATITVMTEIDNDSDALATCTVSHRIEGQDGKAVASIPPTSASIDPWARHNVTHTAVIAHPRLWSVDSPQLYTLRTTIRQRGAAVDEVTTAFGVRTLRWDANQGLLLNGHRIEVKGTCNHQDHAGVGSALPDRLQEYRIERLKAMGSNAYRTSHNPPTPELLDACDRLGMLVLDETRSFSPEEEGQSQLERMIRRDRNHPCIIAWSLANEEGRDQSNERGTRMMNTMRRLAHRLDPSRLVTAAMNGSWGKGFTLATDIQGLNYFLGDIDAVHRQFPDQPMLGTEVASTLCTRGIYTNDPARGYVSAYDVNKPGWGATAEGWWPYFDARKFLAGGFVWTGFDYRGEPTPYQWPCTSSHFGIMDTCGFPKDNFYYYRAWWGSEPSLHLFPHWNWSGKEGQPVEVWVHANVEEVELLLNGASQGRKPMPRNGHLVWQVPYAAGAIEARGYTGGIHVLSARRETTGPAAAIVLMPDRNAIRADGEDLAVIEVRIVDENGRIVPTADNPVSFTVASGGRILGVGNGDPSSHEPDQASARSAFNGMCCLLVQAGTAAGALRVEAASAGLRSGQLDLQLLAATGRASTP